MQTIDEIILSIVGVDISKTTNSTLNVNTLTPVDFVYFYTSSESTNLDVIVNNATSLDYLVLFCQENNLPITNIFSSSKKVKLHDKNIANKTIFNTLINYKFANNNNNVISGFPPIEGYFLLQENGYYLLQEDGYKIIW